MATTASIQVTEGSGKYVAAYSFTGEDSVTKTLQRIVLNDSSGVEKQVLANPGFTTLTPNTTGGWTPFTNTNTPLTNTKVQVKATQGVLGGYAIYNPNAVAVYVQVFCQPSSGVTVGSTVPDFVIPIAPGATANVEFANGIQKSGGSTGLTIAATTTQSGSTAPTTALPFTILFD